LREGQLYGNMTLLYYTAVKTNVFTIVILEAKLQYVLHVFLFFIFIFLHTLIDI